MRSLPALVLGACCAWTIPSDASPPLRPDQKEKLEAWYDALGPPRASEPFGGYLARAARVQHGVGYEVPASTPGVETLHINLDAFECVSFIESATAVARCAWSGEPDERCFTEELERARYRGGAMGDYASRLHYFIDWIGDNEARGRIENLTTSLGGKPVQKEFYIITRRELPKTAFEQETLAAVTRDVLLTEKRLSSASHDVLDRERAPEALRGLQDGDIVAFVRERPGLLVHHAGFVSWANGTPRLLHASSYHERVVITERDIVDYLLRRPERKGVVIARPSAPLR